jgi:glycerol-3-phosphate responsive antiterminator
LIADKADIDFMCDLIEKSLSDALEMAPDIVPKNLKSIEFTLLI